MAVAGSLSWRSRRCKWCGCAKPQKPTTAKQPKSDVVYEGMVGNVFPRWKGKVVRFGRFLDCEGEEDKAGLCERVDRYDDDDALLARLGRTWR